MPKKQAEKEPMVIYNSPGIVSSVKKGKPYCRLIIGKSFYQALFALSKYIQKVPKFLVEVLQQSVTTLSRRNFNLSYVYIKTITVNKRSKTRRLNYRARGRASIRYKHQIYFKIHFGRRNIKSFFTDLALGVNHTNLVHVVHEYIQTHNIGFEELRALQWVLTAKGRQQQRLMVKRRALYQLVHFRKANVKVPLKFLFEAEAEREAEMFMKKWAYLFDDVPGIGKELEERKALHAKRKAEAEK